jgi:hypothetical protein
VDDEERLKSPGVVGEAALKRTESLDSLIPRNRFNTSPDGAVVKTTTIEVTVSAAKQSGRHGLVGMGELSPRLAEALVTASGRGRARGATAPAKELSSLLDLGAGQTGSGGNV